MDNSIQSEKECLISVAFAEWEVCQNILFLLLNSKGCIGRGDKIWETARGFARMFAGKYIDVPAGLRLGNTIYSEIRVFNRKLVDGLTDGHKSFDLAWPDDSTYFRPILINCLSFQKKELEILFKRYVFKLDEIDDKIQLKIWDKVWDFSFHNCMIKLLTGRV